MTKEGDWKLRTDIGARIGTVGVSKIPESEPVSTSQPCGNDLENHDDELEPEISVHGAALLGLG